MNNDKTTLAKDALATEEAGWQRPDDRFIPLRPCDLAARLAEHAESFGMSSADLMTVASAMEQSLDGETATLQRAATNEYARYNPDRDTLPGPDEVDPTDDDYGSLCQQLGHLLDKANYDRLSDVQIEQAVLSASRRSLKVRVHPDRVEFLEVWIRGRGTEQREERMLWRPWRKIEYTIDVFRRMMVVARLKDSQHVLLKLFKDIPEAEVEALLPHAEATMTLFDRFKLFAAGAGAVGTTLWKVVQLLLGIFALTKLFWILLVGVVTLGMRSILGYRRAHIDRDWQRTRHLYFQNLGNNASALQLLVSTVKQEELKEALLVYVFCHDTARTWHNEATLCDAVEAWLQKHCKVRVDFDIADALDKLHRLNLFADDSQLQTVSPAVAVARLSGSMTASPLS